MANAIVVGSGPNGLTAAVTLAAAGVDVTVLEGQPTVGGGTRTAELTLPGLRHDVCAAVHPLALLSPALRALPLADHGLRWRVGEVGLAHPLDDGGAAVEGATLDATAAGLGADADRWRRLLGPVVDDLEDLGADVLGPLLRLPTHPAALARFGVRGALPATTLARTLRTPAARALLAGAAAHAIRPLGQPLTAAVGVLLLAAGQQLGWPVAEGGSQAIADALVSLLVSLGGRVESGVWVHDLDELPPADAVLLDVSPRAAVALCGDRLAPRARAAFSRWRYGPGSFKLDLAVDGGVPWQVEAVRRAVTVHVGGTVAEIAAAERSVVDGRMPSRPFVLVAQQHVADPTRAPGDVVPVWAYCHVPHGWEGDATEAVLAQLERFAPGTRERIVAQHVTGPAELEAYDPNYVGGDIATGANDVWQTLVRPRPSWRPYRTTAPGVWLCSAATPPGAGVHGMSGHHAAQDVLRTLG